MGIVVAGPSGVGKTVVGEALAARLGAPFVDGDVLHPPENIAKMSAGVPLTDADRWPWLDRVAAAAREGAVVACSALARRYRDRLRAGDPAVRFIVLSADAAVLEERMRARTHFMPPSLLASQLALVEPLDADEPGVALVSDLSPQATAERALDALGGTAQTEPKN
ncbi:MAG: gluconokinase [Microbacterium ginsengisoli]|mgnify:FL=1|uniref:gluconokinase n=1 Tax=Microbacterium TaxID=33882 RepID=UPI0006FDA055|nr:MULTISPECIES: gluconokinase [unclassified Microbacterium]MBN9199373.1 gluconokinase [Microbacterium ginsengisoli]KQR90615.1 hypothetical protein ASG00_06105 [Microbacterium sp. Leaf351]KQR96802.1 hypothetical protein ASF93_02170 [Microbacterium sp. Leaf347]ODU75297.1 MAG: hypothetical protein ABT08_10350 [Microbacterium sp. SCN 71-21]OJU78656.1 MAG: hypothetical protein BGO15_14200 [Microbacterium sp. 71-23]